MNKKKKIEEKEDEIEEHSHIEHYDREENLRLKKEIERDIQTVHKKEERK